MKLFDCCYPGCESDATHYFKPKPPFASQLPDGRIYVCFRHVSAYTLSGVCDPMEYYPLPNDVLWFLRNSGRMGEWLGWNVDDLETLAERYKREDEGIPENWKP